MFLSLCWLLIAIAYEAEGRVDNDFTHCSETFFKKKMPVGFEGIARPHGFAKILDGIQETTDLVSPAYICQTLGEKSYYATLYDRGRRIPLYSAYILDRKSTDKKPDCRRPIFQIEPQLIHRGLTENMQFAKDLTKTIKKDITDNTILEKLINQQNVFLNASQAINSDYTDDRKAKDKKGTNTYNRGHLNPCGHHKEKDNYMSTFTLTNVVPMPMKLNGGAWSEYEQKMTTTISVGCSKMYVVTGAVPGNNALKGRVSIPSYVWNAYCCVDNNDKPIKSGGAIAANDLALITDNKFKVDEITLSDLQNRLKKYLRVSKNIEIFSCGCNIQSDSSSC